MHVCLISNQIAAWGKLGGFGTATRALGAALARRGFAVSAVVPRRPGQRPREELDGIRVHGESAWATLAGGEVFRRLRADVYHSQEPTVASRWAQRAAPGAVHVVTCRDPRDWRDHALELRYSGWRRRALFPATWAYEVAPWVKAAVRRADAVLCPAPFLRVKVRRLYGVDARFLPSPVALPAGEPAKAPDPLVLFVGRWDRRKRIERFFALAERFPAVRFIAVGRAHENGYDESLRRLGARIGNLEMVGEASPFGDSGDLASWYERAWVLVNTSAREALPYTFLEAAAHGVALLSSLDPEGITSRFGQVVEGDRYEEALAWLLADGVWRERGRAGSRWVAEGFSEARSTDLHLELYASLLALPSSAGRHEERQRSVAG